MKTITLNRFLSTEKGTLGFIKELEIFSLELPWKNNEHNTSCIPTGSYNISDYHSDHFKVAYKLSCVPNREGILIHRGNAISDIKGCIIVGTNADFRNEGYYVWSSNQAFDKLRNYINNDHAILTIKD